jgi:hypothetical protein
MAQSLGRKYGYRFPAEAIARNGGREVPLCGTVADCMCTRMVGKGTPNEELTLRRCTDAESMTGKLRKSLRELFGVGENGTKVKRITVVTYIDKKGKEDRDDPEVEHSRELSATGCPSGEKRPTLRYVSLIIANKLRNILQSLDAGGREILQSLDAGGKEIGRIIPELLRTRDVPFK